MTKNISEEEKFTDDDLVFVQSSPVSDIMVEENNKLIDQTEVSNPDENTSPILIPSYINKTREQTRGNLAMIFVIGFYTMLLLGGLLVAFDNSVMENKVKNLQDVFLVISGVLSGPLGFVVGYYFRKQEEIENQ